MSEESTDANNPAQLQHETTMSPDDCDRMERAAEHVERANELCRLAGLEIDRLKAKLWKYGKHLTACRLQNRTETWCDCGWKEVRATLAPQSDGEANER